MQWFMDPHNASHSTIFIYRMAAQLGRHYDCSSLINIDSSGAYYLLPLHAAVRLFQNQANICRHLYRTNCGAKMNFEIDTAIVASSIIVVPNLLELNDNLELTLSNLNQLMDYAPVALLTARLQHQWSLKKLVQLVQSNGLQVEFAGGVPNDSDSSPAPEPSALVIVAPHHRPPIRPAPNDFRVVAIMPTYNETDIITPSIKYLRRQGVAVYVVDNWSDDGTFEQAQALLGQGVMGLERFPANGYTGGHTHNWFALLERTEHLAHTLDADWFIHHDVDERRESPWPDVTLRDALYHVEQCGFNSVDHTVLQFGPIDNGFAHRADFAAYFSHYRFGSRMGHFVQIKAWKQQQDPVNLAASGGHHVRFANQRIYPFKFLLRHYPLRTEQQAVRKIWQRQNRSNPFARAIGWHHTYDHLHPDNPAMFTELCEQTRATYHVFDPEKFYVDNLIARLTGIGLHVHRKPLLTRLNLKILKLFSRLVRHRLRRTNWEH